MILDSKPELKAKIKKYGKWFVIFLIIAFLAELVVRFSYKLDDDKAVVEEFLLNNQLILSKTGEIEELSWGKTVTFSGDNYEGPYKKYLYRIKGTNTDALVRVKLDKLCDEGEQCLKIISLE